MIGVYNKMPKALIKSTKQLYPLPGLPSFPASKLPGFPSFPASQPQGLHMKTSITTTKLIALKNGFDAYVDTFRSDDPQIQQSILLKKDHTLRVCEEIVALGEKLHLNPGELRLAEAIALLHDIGRFEQYTRYKTFVDRLSENHAELGVRILDKEGVLDAVEAAAGDVIRYAIRHHNRRKLPEEAQGPRLFYLKLIRDADKLDIWKVVTDYYALKRPGSNMTLELDLPDSPGISAEVRRQLLDRRGRRRKARQEPERFEAAPGRMGFRHQFSTRHGSPGGAGLP